MKIRNLLVEKESFTLSINSLDFTDTDKVAIIGKSGSGKTTLLNAIGNIIEYQGTIEESKQVVYATQFGDLIEEFNVNTNVIMGKFGNQNVFKNIILTLTNDSFEILRNLKIEGLKTKKVKYLSGGEKQRVLICRSLNTNGDTYLFDEPTSSLDIKNSSQSIELILEELSSKLVICTIHNLDLLKYFNRIIVVEDGNIIADTQDKTNMNFGDYFD